MWQILVLKCLHNNIGKSTFWHGEHNFSIFYFSTKNLFLYEKVLIFTVCCDIHTCTIHEHVLFECSFHWKTFCLKHTINPPPFTIPCAQVEFFLSIQHLVNLPELPNFIACTMMTYYPYSFCKCLIYLHIC